MKELIDFFKEKYDFASWSTEGKETGKAEAKPFHLLMEKMPEYVRVSRRILPRAVEGSYYTLVEELAETGNCGKRFRVMTTSYHTPKAAVEGMLMNLIAAESYVKVDNGRVCPAELCFIAEDENPCIGMCLTDKTVVRVYALHTNPYRDDLFAVLSTISSRIREKERESTL
ncbi:MAG: hypothetical protein LKI39_05680 [Bacteroides sp.]|jgi:hypothetical protein|nr:hypothetical protein [Bacteroides sp.]MCI1682029.1 hypothetical protein [Bacteroides sp.]